MSSDTKLFVVTDSYYGDPPEAITDDIREARKIADHSRLQVFEFNLHHTYEDWQAAKAADDVCKYVAEEQESE